MKRMITGLLALILLVSAYISPVSASEKKISEEALALVNYFEIMNLDEDADAEVSREDFAVYLGRAIGVNEYAQNAEMYYYDIPAEHWAAESVNRITEKGGFTVPEDKLFRLKDTVKVSEAITVFVNLLGYKEAAEINGGYPNGYMKVASELSLFDNNVAMSGNLTKRAAAELISNAMEADICGLELSDGANKLVPHEGQTLFSLYRNMYPIKGTVESVAEMALYPGQETLEGYIRIDGKEYLYEGNNELVGRYVKGYYISERGEEEKIAYLVDQTKESEVLEVTAESFMSFDDDYKLEYSDLRTGTVKNVKIPRNAAFIYNGVAADGEILSKMNITEGYIRLLKRRGSSEYNTVFIWSAETFAVGYIDSAKKIIFDSADGSNTINFSEENASAEVVRIFDNAGKETDFSAILDTSVLTVYKNGTKVINIYISNEEITGTYQGKQMDEKYTYYLVDDAEIIVSKKYESAVSKKVTAGREQTFYVDMFGNIAAAADVIADGEFIYGYFINQIYDSVDEKLYVKMYSETEGVKRFELKERVKIDGTRRKTPAASSEQLSENFEAANEAYLKLPDRSTLVMPRLLRYKVNDEGLVSEIDTPYTDKSKELEEDHLYIDGALATRAMAQNSQSVIVTSGVAVSGWRIVHDTSTLVLTVPKDTDLPSATEKMFSKNTTGGALGKEINIVSYKTSPEHGMSDVIINIKDVDSVMYSYNAMLVKRTGIMLDEDGLPVSYMDGFVGSTEKRYILSSTAKEWSGIHNTLDEAGVEVGDIVMVTANPAGEVDTFFLAYDRSENICYDLPAVKAVVEGGMVVAPAKNAKLMFTNLHSDSYLDMYNVFYAYGTFSMGYVSSVKEGVISIGHTRDGSVDEVYAASSKPCIVYDEELGRNDGFYVGKISDVVSFEDAGKNCSTIVAVHDAANWKWYYIYK